MITGKFNELFNKYNDATYIGDRRIKVKLKEIIACYEECDLAEQEFTYEIIDKFCELIELMDERNEEERQALLYNYEGAAENLQKNLNKFVAYQNNQDLCKDEYVPYEFADDLLIDFYESFNKKKSASTMKDYVARIKTFAYSNQYLGEMLRLGVLGVREVNTDPVLFTYANIEVILARFNTKDENGNVVKQRNNIRSALRLLNDFKREKEI